MAVTEHKAERVGIWTRRDIKALLRQAIVYLPKTFTELRLKLGIRKAGTYVADDSLADQRIFEFNEREWQDFQDILNRPVKHKPRLAQLLNEKSTLE